MFMLLVPILYGKNKETRANTLENNLDNYSYISNA